MGVPYRSPESKGRGRKQPPLDAKIFTPKFPFLLLVRGVILIYGSVEAFSNISKSRRCIDGRVYTCGYVLVLYALFLFGQQRP